MRTRLVVIAASIVVAAAGAPALAQDVARGEVLFDLCASCHGERGEGNEMFLAPAIAGLDQWYVEAQLEKFQTGVRGAHPDDLAGLRMRPMSRTLRSDEDRVSVAAYVASLPPVRTEPTLSGGDPVKGKALYGPCVACHGPEGKGNQALFGPRLTGSSDWYLLTQLDKFRQGVRGGNPKDQTGILMRPMALTLADEQAMKDVIAHIMTLGE